MAFSTADIEKIHSEKTSRYEEQEKLRYEQERKKRQKAGIDEIHWMFQQQIKEGQHKSRDEFVSRVNELMKAEDIRDDKLMEMSFLAMKKESIQSRQELEKIEKNMNAYREAVSLLNRDIDSRKAFLRSLKESITADTGSQDR